MFLLLFLAPLAVDLLGLIRRDRALDDAAAPELHLPLPGPAAGGGAVRFMLCYHLSSSLAILNPGQRREVWLEIRGEREARLRLGGREPDPVTYTQQVPCTLPFRGEWLAMNGGVTPATSHSWHSLAQRYAYDFVIADADGRRHRGDGSRPEDYFCYDEPVLAPADGVVVAVVDGVRDAPRVGTGWVDWRAGSVGGNSVTIRHADGEYSYLAHLVPGSICVRPDQRVGRGEEVGRCGNSGHSTEPHLHFQLQDHPEFHRAAGLPVRFSAVLTPGSDRPRALHLTRGTRVRTGWGGDEDPGSPYS